MKCHPSGLVAHGQGRHVIRRVGLGHTSCGTWGTCARTRAHAPGPQRQRHTACECMQCRQAVAIKRLRVGDARVLHPSWRESGSPDGLNPCAIVEEALWAPLHHAPGLLTDTE
jgi:hypothetical protein